MFCRTKKHVPACMLLWKGSEIRKTKWKKILRFAVVLPSIEHHFQLWMQTYFMCCEASKTETDIFLCHRPAQLLSFLIAFIAGFGKFF